MKFKIFVAVLSILLILFGTVQINDPDPFLWIGIYFVGAFFVAWSLKPWQPLVLALAALFFIACVVFAIVNWPTVWLGFEQTNPPDINIEKARESCGLLCTAFFVFIAYALNLLTQKKKVN